MLVVTFTASIYADARTHPLWQKAKIIAQNNELWVPGKLEQTARQKNSKGKIKSEESIAVKHWQVGQGIGSSLISSDRDGKPIPQDDDRVQDLLSENLLDNSSLFYNFAGQNLLVTLQSEIRTIEGKQCRGFDYQFTRQNEKGKNLQSTGTVWIDTLTAIPILNEMQVQSPKKVVKNMTIRNQYNYDEKAWYIDKVEMRFQLSLLVVKYFMEIDRSYSDYWLFQEDAPVD